MLGAFGGARSLRSRRLVAPRPALAACALAAIAVACNTSSPPSGARRSAEPASARSTGDPRVRVQGTRFLRDGQPFPVVGCNYWSAATDSRTEAGRARVARELDRLAALGVNVLRILALSEGSDGEPGRLQPSLQPSPGQFSPEGLAGLDWLMAELAGRGLYGIFILNNFWFWSGGTSQYLSWARGVGIPFPRGERPDWERYEAFSAEFFGDAGARALFEAALRTVIPRHAGSPAVFAWELVNEPHPRHDAAAFRRWLDDTARLVHALDPHHLVTTGTEGNTPAPEHTGVDVALDHASVAIDFVSVHLWPENWGWTRLGASARAFDDVAELSRGYLRDHERAALALGKPALLLETGFPRDGGAFDPAAPVSARDRYLELIFDITLDSLESGGALAGAFPWSWSGETLPLEPGALAQQPPFTGDPPHERQGWYSIYASDSTTALMARYAARFRAAAR
jgi:mannan endo-1,4-beta-mannosidase